MSAILILYPVEYFYEDLDWAHTMATTHEISRFGPAEFSFMRPRKHNPPLHDKPTRSSTAGLELDSAHKLSLKFFPVSVNP